MLVIALHLLNHRAHLCDEQKKIIFLSLFCFVQAFFFPILGGLNEIFFPVLFFLLFSFSRMRRDIIFGRYFCAMCIDDAK